MPIVPKGPVPSPPAPTNVTPIGRKKRGRGLGYNLETGITYGEDFNVFAGDAGGGYRPDRYYTEARDQNGHGERLNIRVPLGMDSQIHKAVAEVGQYASIHDFARDAFMHRLEWLRHNHDLGEGVRRMLELARKEADGEARIQEADSMQGAVDKLIVRLQSLWERTDIGLLAEEISEGNDLIDWLREPYRSKAREVLEDWKRKAKAEIAKMHANLED